MEGVMEVLGRTLLVAGRGIQNYTIEKAERDMEYLRVTQADLSSETTASELYAFIVAKNKKTDARNAAFFSASIVDRTSKARELFAAGSLNAVNSARDAILTLGILEAIREQNPESDSIASAYRRAKEAVTGMDEIMRKTWDDHGVYYRK